ncbi:MAG: cytidylate kinase-like family protein [candidate division Zixibacteria bacterium]|nr:cytidylate kinase-like family protein [candidate division Zixibacteria bacterium]
MRSIEAIIASQFKVWEKERLQREAEGKSGAGLRIRPIVTFSRQKGSLGLLIAEKLAKQLDYRILRREIVDEICKSAGYQKKIIQALDGKVPNPVEFWLEGLFKGQYVTQPDYTKSLVKVILSMSELGGVLVIGRGANFILPPERRFSLRTIAALPCRIENLQRYEKLSPNDARDEIIRNDRTQTEFIRTTFRRDINDSSAYDLVVNTTNIDVDSAVKICDEAIRAKWRQLESAAPGGEN